MPAEIRGGVSTRHRLPNQDQIAQAEAALQARTVPGTRAPLPPPPPLPPEALDSPEQDSSPLAGMGHAGVPLTAAIPAEPPQPLDAEVEPLSGRVAFTAEGIVVVLKAGKRPEVTGSGASVAEAMGIAASELEEQLAVPVCPHCGQVMPQEN